jgi:hypothetical protein
MTTTGPNAPGASIRFTPPPQMTVGHLRKLVAHLDEEAVADRVPFQFVSTECPGHLAVAESAATTTPTAS